MVLWFLIASLSVYLTFYNLLQVWWAASDLGWVVGHSYICYAPLLHGNSTILYEVTVFTVYAFESNCKHSLVEWIVIFTSFEL